MKKQAFKVLAKLNKMLLPSYTKQKLDLSKATKLQMAIFGWKVYVTKNALD
ncbi:SsrA-binding protein [Olleya sp. YS]|uniref:SsrA-binding protein n=1 Tax=Olleya sp. YS TaxID=3028318 RepID=UPI0024342C68|nr:SsrA-binding protein [Olleya sp. YS]WGD33859.1 SsrA-binding protein [Olleya sp. YS]